MCPDFRNRSELVRWASKIGVLTMCFRQFCIWGFRFLMRKLAFCDSGCQKHMRKCIRCFEKCQKHMKKSALKNRNRRKHNAKRCFLEPRTASLAKICNFALGQFGIQMVHFFWCPWARKLLFRPFFKKLRSRRRKKLGFIIFPQVW